MPVMQVQGLVHPWCLALSCSGRSPHRSPRRIVPPWPSSTGLLSSARPARISRGPHNARLCSSAPGPAAAETERRPNRPAALPCPAHLGCAQTFHGCPYCWMPRLGLAQLPPSKHQGASFDNPWYFFVIKVGLKACLCFCILCIPPHQSCIPCSVNPNPNPT